MRTAHCGGLLLALTVIVANGAAARGQAFDELANRVPAGANAIVLLDVDKVMNCPLGVQHDWKTKHEQRFAAGLSVIPADAKQAIFAMRIDLAAMEPQWESSVMRLNAAADLPNLAEMSGGKLETIAGDKTVALPPDAYAVQFSPTLVGAMAPADRQAAGRWIRETNAATRPSFSPYLAEAYGYANNLGTPIILAIDLQDIHSADEVLAALKKSDKFSDQSQKELERLAKMLAGIRGLTLGVTLGDKPYGKVKVDFSDDVGLLPDVAKVMLLHALTKRRAMLNDLQSWSPKVSGNQVTLEGNLTPSGLKRIFSLFDRPPSFTAPADTAAATATTSDRPVATPATFASPAKTAPAPSAGRTEVDAAQAYFKRVVGFVTDLRDNSGNSGTLAASATWYESYARKIDELSVLGIDPDLVAYAQRTADALRQASGSIETDNYKRVSGEASPHRVYVTQTLGRQYSYGWRQRDAYGGYRPYQANQYVVKNLSRQGVEHKEIAKAGLASSQILQTIDADTAAVRQEMSLKYNVNF